MRRRELGGGGGGGRIMGWQMMLFRVRGQHILVFSQGMRTLSPALTLMLPVGDGPAGQEEDPSGAMQPGS